MTSLAEQIKAASQAIEAAQISDSARLDAELLMAFCLQKTRTYLYTWPENTPSQNQQACFDRLLQLRLQGQPIAHLIGEREFWGLNLKVTADTLIPRPDTEILIETALSKLSPPNSQLIENQHTPQGAIESCSLLDLGTGSGAIALALKSELPS